tara:strand:+ start:157 stop:591 length:435 start_codon:yes stop_codon:yes gene_type:complete
MMHNHQEKIARHKKLLDLIDLFETKKVIVGESNKIVPHPLLQGSFKFDAITGLANVSDNQKIIWGFDDNIVRLDAVLSKVSQDDQGKLLESVNSKELITQTPVIRLKNGNKIQEIFQKKFINGKNGDYEFGSFQGMEGVTRLVA